MTRKDYRVIAEAFVATKPAELVGQAMAQWRRDVVCIADVLALDSGRFDRARFYNACQLYSA